MAISSLRTLGCAALCALFLALPGLAGEASAADPTPSPARARLIEKLYAPAERYVDFKEVADKAAAEKVPEQTIAEARLAFCIRTGILDERLTDTVRELDGLRLDLRWKKEDSKLFNNPDELEGTLYLARALIVERRGDEDEYERCIKEAFWKSPGAAPLFAANLRAHRVWASQLSQITVPLDKPMQDSAGRSVTLKDLFEGRKAVLLEFWASWCDPCMDRMDEMGDRAQTLSKDKILVAAVDVEGDRALAEQVRVEHKMNMPWLIEGKDRALSHILQVDSIPHAVLIGEDGKVLFSGHPRDAALTEALTRLGAEPNAD